MTVKIPTDMTEPTCRDDDNNNDSRPNTASITTTTLPIPVDRQWLRKLLQKHHPKQSDTAAAAVDDNNNNNNTIAYVLAPMVDQSDLPFRLLTRNYNCNLCFTPMIHSKLFCSSPEYREKFTLAQNPTTDRPLIAQICGSEPHTVLQAALALAPYCDGIDINCGCPQNIAKRGMYGAFLLEQEELLLRLVTHLVQHLPVPVSVKVRLLPAPTRDASVQQSLALYEKLVDAGVHMLTIHGRTRHHKGHLTGQADWTAIRQVVEQLGDRIPILANGSMGNWKDIQDCLHETKADGVMCSEAILEYPALFSTSTNTTTTTTTTSTPTTITAAAAAAAPPPPQTVTHHGGRTIGRVALAKEYLELAKQYPPNKGGQGSGIKCMRVHVHRILHADLQEDLELRKRIIRVNTWHGLMDALDWLEERHAQQGHDVSKESLSWYKRHRFVVQDKSSGLFVNLSEEKRKSESTVKTTELSEDAAECFGSLFGGGNDDDDDDDDEY